jgi:DNA primase catalytic core
MATDLKTAIAQIKAAYTISDYIKASGVSLTASGAGKWKGLCQFHQEKSPSFTVSDHFQNYRCWGCGATGDLLKWVMETENLEFMDALRKLADDRGIQLEISGSEEGSIDYKSLRECLKESANFFAREYHKLTPDHPARKQVTDRGISEKGMIYGYAPEKRTALYDHLRSKSFSDEVILQAGVATKWEESGKVSDFWSGRLMFVITDITGKPIGFSGRKLFEGDKRGKFVNSQAGPLFDKSSALFNIQNAKAAASDTKTVYVAEGQFDVAAFIEAGVPNTVASSGTAFTQAQGKILQRLVGEAGKVVFAFDGDKAGIAAALKVFKNVPGLHSGAWVVQFPEGKDPCDYRLENGNEALQKLVADPIPLVSFVLDAAKSDHDLRTEVGRAQYLDYAAKVLVTVSSSSLRGTFTRKVALDTFTEVEVLKELMKTSSPLELASESDEEAKEYVVPEELKDEVSIPLLELIENSEAYALAARFLALAVLDRELIQHLPKNKKRLPSEFGHFIDTLVELDENEPIIPEAFEESDLVRYLTDSELFPLSGLASFDPKSQFAYVYKRYMKSTQESKENEVHARIHSILATSTDSHVELLAEALRSEENFLKETAFGTKTISHRDESEVSSDGDQEEES